MAYNYIIEEWWRHQGTYDRMMASKLLTTKKLEWTDEDNQEFLRVTDDWWDSLTGEEKEKVYEEFFDES